MRHILARLGSDERTPAVAWSIAAAAFVAALAIRFALAEILPPGYPFLTFFPAVILTTYICGLAPGIVVAVASGFAAWYFFIPPFRSLQIDGASAFALAFYAFIVTVDIIVIHVMTAALGRLRHERERSERLAESRDTMFKELQHRISNNLQVVSSLMHLQKRTLTDPQARHIIDEASSRLHLIGKIHRQLYDPAGQEIEFGAFLEDLCRDVLEAAGVQRIACLVRADPLVLPAEQTVPVALIVTELISNAIEHGFAGEDTAGTIKVDVACPASSDEVTLSVADDGAGLHQAFDLDTSPSLGLRIIRSLADQLGGTMTLQPNSATLQGSIARLTFTRQTVSVLA